ncbi:MAG: NADAR family protein [Bdellovibrionota bacterium]
MKLRIKLLIYSIMFLGCVSVGHISTSVQDEFPDIWWQPVPDDQVASWEIPPQAADRAKSEVVLSKRNELGQFSNLWDTPFSLDGDFYGSVEGLWQAMKYPENKEDERFKDPTLVWPFTREQVMKLSGFEAKKAGDLASANMKKLGIKWITYKGEKIEYIGKDTLKHYELILRACRAKLAANPQLVELLRRTKSLKFIADHKQKADSPPAYKYHEIYMKLRNE